MERAAFFCPGCPTVIRVVDGVSDQSHTCGVFVQFRPRVDESITIGFEMFV